MERFKILEKETKTKAYSKEALANNKPKQKMTKKQLEKVPYHNWIDEAEGEQIAGSPIMIGFF